MQPRSRRMEFSKTNGETLTGIISSGSMAPRGAAMRASLPDQLDNRDHTCKHDEYDESNADIFDDWRFQPADDLPAVEMSQHCLDAEPHQPSRSERHKKYRSA